MLANVFDITSCFRLSLPCGGRLISVIHIRSMEKISTHALRGEGDLCVIARDKFKLAFQSTPSVGRATMPSAISPPVLTFQSTPSVGRATCFFVVSVFDFCHFNPRPPWGGRPRAAQYHLLTRLFQSTPSVGRATGLPRRVTASVRRFQSTPSVGRATGYHANRRSADNISIHALRGEGDSKNIQICNIVFVHSAYKIIYLCDSCAFYLT